MASRAVDTATKQINQTQGNIGFIKVTDSPLNLSSEQKAQLNRRGNVLFNQGNVEEARKIFTATGYSDGLSRVGDNYKASGKTLDALKEYYLAHNKKKAEPLYESLAEVIRQMLKS